MSYLTETLWWQPVEDSNGPVSFQVKYRGMEPTDEWTPSVRELYSVMIWVDEADTDEEWQTQIQTAARAAFNGISALLNATIIFSSVSVAGEYETTGPQIELVFRTIDPMGI